MRRATKHHHRPWAGVVAAIGLLATTAALLLAGPASALTVELTKYDGVYPAGSFTGSDNLGGAPEFSNLEQVDIDQTNDFIYATASGYVYKFDMLGVSQPFSGLGGNTVFAQESGFLGDIEVDNSGTATQGNIYVANDSASFYGYSPAGTPLPGYPVSNGGETCGMAVGPDGHIWAGRYPNFVREFDPSTSPPTFVKEISFSPGTSGLCDFDIDSQGNFLVPDFYFGGPVYKYPPSGNSRILIDPANSRGVTTDLSNDHIYVAVGDMVNHYDSDGTLLESFGAAEGPPTEFPGSEGVRGLAIDEDTHSVYVANKQAPQRVDRFALTPPITIPTVTTNSPTVEPTAAVLRGVVNGDGVDTTDCQFEWGPVGSSGYGNKIECAEGKVFSGASGDHNVSAEITGLTQGSAYHFRLTAKNANEVVSKGGDQAFHASGLPIALSETVSKVNTDGTQFNVTIDPNGGVTTWQVEWGEEALVYGNTFPEPAGQLASNTAPESFKRIVSGLQPETEYHYRLTAHNDAGTYFGPDRRFRTYGPDTGIDLCDNTEVRRQTTSSLLLDCRAYELVSAANAGGNDVESDLVPGQEPLRAYPNAVDKLLYSVHAGQVPGVSGSPTNFGRDPYLATRTDGGWATRYVGLPSDGMADEGAFGSPLLEADSTLSQFAFGGEDICDPCFGSATNIPFRSKAGIISRGMVGSLNPEADPAGFVFKRFSADGRHFVFGAEQPFETGGMSGSVSIYDRDLASGQTQLVSTLDDGETMSGEVGELDVSADGSRIVVGQILSTDAAGNDLWHPYMHIGTNSDSVDLAPAANEGVIYAGMSADGSRVFFSSSDQLVPADTDSSADVYEAEVDGGPTADLRLVSTDGADPSNDDACNPPGALPWNKASGSPDCSAVVFAGAAGVAPDGTLYFSSPEILEGSNGAADEVNLYAVKPGGTPQFVATIDSSAGKPGPQPIDHQGVLNGVEQAAVRDFSDFQVSNDGRFAIFSSSQPLGGALNEGHLAVFLYDSVSETLTCVSCASTLAAATTDTGLPAHGSGLTEDGRVFFSTMEPLVLRDSNGKRDAYEYDRGHIQLISSGVGAYDSGLLSVSADGKDAFFFTRDALVDSDENGNAVKVYDAREGGGFFEDPPLQPCAASDECHGAGTQPPPSPVINTIKGWGELPAARPKPKRCRKGTVRRHGKCVKRHRKGRPGRNRG